jgi:ribosome recycling factor
LDELARLAAAEMKDYRASIDKLRRDAAEAALIRDLATDHAKRAMYDNLHKHFNRLADEVEQTLKLKAAE